MSHGDRFQVFTYSLDCDGVTRERFGTFRFTRAVEVVDSLRQAGYTAEIVPASPRLPG